LGVGIGWARLVFATWVGGAGQQQNAQNVQMQ
jgi:hypothetical protein